MPEEKGEESFSQRRQEGKRHKDTGGRPVLNKRSESVSSFYGPTESSPLGSSLCGILQARILEWLAISFSRGSSQPKN